MTRIVTLDPVTRIFRQDGKAPKNKKVKSACRFDVVVKDEETAYAYKRFCFNQDFKPTELLTLFLNTYGGAQSLSEKIGNGETISSEEKLAFIKDIEALSLVNNQLRIFVSQVTGITTKEDKNDG